MMRFLIALGFDLIGDLAHDARVKLQTMMSPPVSPPTPQPEATHPRAPRGCRCAPCSARRARKIANLERERTGLLENILRTQLALSASPRFVQVGALRVEAGFGALERSDGLKAQNRRRVSRLGYVDARLRSLRVEAL